MSNGSAAGAFSRYRRQSAHSVPPPGFVNLWVNDSDGKLYTTDENGTDTPFSGGTGAFLNVTNTWSKAQVVSPVALTDASSIVTDASLSTNFTVTLGGNRTLANPTNLIAGGTYLWRIKQDGTGGRTLAFGNLFKFAGGVAPVMSTGASMVDIITGYYDGTIICANFAGNYA